MNLYCPESIFRYELTEAMSLDLNTHDAASPGAK